MLSKDSAVGQQSQQETKMKCNQNTEDGVGFVHIDIYTPWRQLLVGLKWDDIRKEELKNTNEYINKESRAL